MSFSPQLFLTNIKAKDGLARPNRFQTILPIPQYVNSFVGNSIFEKILNFPNSIAADITDIISNIVGNQVDEQSKTSNASLSRYLSMQCEATELPGKSIVTADAKIYGPTFKVPYQTQYSDVSFTFLCTNEFYEIKLFERWIECIMPSDTNNLRFPKDEKSRYMTNIKIVQYDDFIRQIFAIELIDAFPIAIAPQPVNWADDGFHRLTVQWAFQKYKVIYDGDYDVTQAFLSLFGVSAANFLTGTGQNIANIAGSIFRRIT